MPLSDCAIECKQSRRTRRKVENDQWSPKLRRGVIRFRITAGIIPIRTRGRRGAL